MTDETTGERLLAPSSERLFRQVRVGQVEDGEPSSIAFKALPKDHGELSVDLESLTTAQECYDAFKACGGDTVGVWAVTTQDCVDLGVDSYHKPKTSPPNPSHGYVNFKSLRNDKAYKKLAGYLAERAIKYGRVHPPADEQTQPAVPGPEAQQERRSDESST